MRVITGKSRGRRLITVPGDDIVRPTTEKVKEAVFSSIQFDIEGRKILDLFAGCGQLGIEALSRGAESAVFVDVSPVSIEVIKKNLCKTGLNDRAQVVKSDYSVYLSGCRTKFDIAFLDPPYAAGILENAALATASVMNEHGRIFCEHPVEVELPEAIQDFHVYKKYKFGKILVTAYIKGGGL